MTGQDHQRSEPLLVLGASGLVGRYVLRLARADGWPVLATSRSSPAAGDTGDVQWRCGPGYDLYAGAGPWPPAAFVASVGPLDGLALWLERVRPAGLRRLVALGSTSLTTKRDSPDPAERKVAADLARAEARIQAWCRAAAVHWTILRPTLIWGDGRDRNLSRLAAQARRRRRLILPAFATGRRQPIRAGDVAQAVLAALHAPASHDGCLDLPGGEIVTYREMARRVAACVAPPGRLLLVPGAAVRPAVSIGRRLGLVSPGQAAAITRTAHDLVFDGVPASRALDWSPGPFQPRPEDFPET